jgi:hypothetical protein
MTGNEESYWGLLLSVSRKQVEVDIVAIEDIEFTN